MRVACVVLLCGLAAVLSVALVVSLLLWLDASEVDETDGVLPGTMAHAAAWVR